MTNESPDTDEDMESLVEDLYEKVGVSDDAARETTVDENAGLAYIPPDALAEIADHLAQLEAEAAESGGGSA